MYHKNVIQPLIKEVVANAVSVVNQSAASELDNEKEINNANREQKLITSFNNLQQARCHWIQLAKLDLQLKIIQLTFAYIIEEYKQMRSLWSFGENDQKRHYTMIKDFDNPHAMHKFIRNIGARHFFYDVYEPHTEVICKSMMMALCEIAKDDMNEKQIQCWQTATFNDGLASQRQGYLRQCISKEEIETLRIIWQQVQTKYLREDGNLTKCHVLMYEALQYYCQKIPKTKKYTRKLEEIADRTVDAVNKIITVYDNIYGLTELISSLDSYCYLCCTLNESPRTLWLAFNKGFANIISTKVDEDIIWVKQIWCKIARILEQIIKEFIVSNLCKRQHLEIEWNEI
ncbi:BMA-GLB-5 [Dirofilaria immitis]|nr:BMA-GLB-5 [Dirofilaria immitis]